MSVETAVSVDASLVMLFGVSQQIVVTLIPIILVLLVLIIALAVRRPVTSKFYAGTGLDAWSLTGSWLEVFIHQQTGPCRLIDVPPAGTRASPA